MAAEAFGFECAPDDTFWLAPDRGLYVHANHWIADLVRRQGEGYRLGRDALLDLSR